VSSSSDAARRPWLVVLASAFAVATIALVGALVASGSEHRAGPGPETDRSEWVGAGGLTQPYEGWRWVTWRDVGVQVPESWGDGVEPGPDWCAYGEGRSDRPLAPYVARNSGAGGTLDIGCPPPEDGRPEVYGTAPQEWWTPHVAFDDPGDSPQDGVTDFDGWTMTTRSLGAVQVRVLSNTNTRGLVDTILDSARTFTTDANGCDATSPVQAAGFVRPDPGFDVDEVADVESISICQYDRHRGDDAALMASRRVEGDAAMDLLAGIKDAPLGGGPDRPQHCVDDYYGDHAIAVRLNHDGTTDDLYVYYDWCFGHGVDDGTHRRQLTQHNCAPLFGDGVVAWSYQSALSRICG
jgi:hypothetical protein